MRTFFNLTTIFVEYDSFCLYCLSLDEFLSVFFTLRFFILSEVESSHFEMKFAANIKAIVSG